MARPKGPAADSRTRILAAASDEFGAHGFAAATVDRIARRARVNKAMIYYHFSNKRALYTCIIRDVFTPIAEQVRLAMSADVPPEKKLERLIDAIVQSVDASTHFLPIFLREIADGGSHLGAEELSLLAGIFAAVSGTIAEGVKQSSFQPVHPALAHFTLIGPLVMFRATAPVRARIKSMRHVEIPEADTDMVVRHLQMVARRMLTSRVDESMSPGVGGVETEESFMTTIRCVFLVVAAVAFGACQDTAPATAARVSGQADATEVQVAPEVGGRIIEMTIAEGDRVKQGDVVARLDTRDIDLALQRSQAERSHADAQLRLLLAGARGEDIRQAEAQVAATSADVAAAQADLASAETDLQRFEKLLQSNSGSQKQRDDAATRRDMARDRVAAAQARVTGAREGVARLRAGSRREEIEAARARVAAVDAQIATLEKSKGDATITAPIGGIVTERLLDPGEIVSPRAPIAVLADLNHAWAEVFVDEPMIPRIKLGQAATVFTDAGGPGLPGKVSYVASKAEFTPRNVQTAEDRSKLVYRVKIAVDNSKGILKQGMPVEAEIPLQ